MKELDGNIESIIKNADAISYYVREMQKEEAKKENDRVMLVV
ncbi:hypothetical protein [Granulicatella adiacens]